MKIFNINVTTLLIAIALTATLSGCHETLECVADDNGGSLVIAIDGDKRPYNGDSATTRIAYDDLDTSFETGDEVGVYAWDGTTVVASNIRYTLKSDGTWKASAPVPYNSTYTYYAYYPYRSDHGYTPAASGDADTRFASFITDAGGKFWQANQTTLAAYDASNLCVAAGSHVGSGNAVTFHMAHKRALALFTGEGADEAIFSGSNLPCTIAGRYQFLMKPSTSTTFTIDGESSTLSAAAGRYTTKNIPKLVPLNWLKFTALEDGTFSLYLPSSINTSYVTSVAYSLNNGRTWTTVDNTSSNLTITTPTVTAGNSVMWRGTANRYAYSSSNYSYFSSTGRFQASGNIMSLLYGDSFEGKVDLYNPNKAYCFAYLFRNCAKMTTPPELPATTLYNYCYYNMFYGCSSLTTMPDLPATNLAEGCYYWMFAYCTSLVTPISRLPATTLAKCCYEDMFSNCTALTSAPILPATTLAESCYEDMFIHCESLTTPGTTRRDNGETLL